MKIFIDLGAYNGDTIKKAMHLYPDFDKYIGFEPVPELYKKAKNRFSKDPRVKIYLSAVSSSNGTKKFYISKYKGKISKGSTLLDSKTSNNIKKSKFIKVNTIDFSEFLEKNVNEYDEVVLKVDIEGEEYNLFEYMIKTNSIRFIDKIYCDWHYDKIGVSKERHDKIVSDLVFLNFSIKGNNSSDAM
jgi:FkbM family methyltransferase